MTAAPSPGAKTPPAPLLPGILAASVLLPLAAWSPYVLRDPRLDGALLGLITLAALLAVRLHARLLPGSLPILAALGLGAARLLAAPAGPAGETLASPPLSALLGAAAERAPLLAGWLLACVAAARPRALRQAAPWILGGVIACSAYGLLQALGPDPLGLRPEPHSPPVAPFAGTNAAVELLVPLLLAGAARLPRRGRWRLFVPALAVPALQAGFLGVLAARLSLGAGLVWLAWRPGRRRRAALLLLAFAAGELLRVLTATPSTETAPEGPLPLSAHIRLLGWESTLAMAAEQPLGIGLGRYEALHPWWRGNEELRLMASGFQDPATPRADHPHDEVLLFLAECGWAGAVLVLVAAWRLLRRRRRARWTNPALLALGIHALVRAPLAGNPPALALAALLVAWHRPSAQPPPQRGGRTARAILLLLALAAALPAPFQILGELRVAQHFRALDGDGEPDPAPLAAAVALRPWDAVAWSLLAADLSATGAGPPAVREALREALRQDPANLFALTALFRLEMTAPDRDERLGLAALARAERLAPEHPSVREGRTLWLEEQARRAQEEARRRAGDGPAVVQTLLLRTWLLRSLAALRRGDSEQAGEALRRASRHARERRLSLERLAKQPTLDEAQLREAVADLLPELEPLLGPPPTPPSRSR